MMESKILENVVDNIHTNCNGEMLVIDGSNADFGEDNNLLSSLKSRRLSEAISFVTQVTYS